jgi:transcriptional regulator with XRE-family HTH domain
MRRPALTAAQILAWADGHHERTGAWPRRDSGPILESPGDTWSAVHKALQAGLRGLKGGTTLYRLLKENRQIDGRRSAVCVSKVKSPGPGRHAIRINLSADVLARYRAGELTSQGIAEVCGVSVSVALRELRRAGASIRSRGRRIIRIDFPEDVLARYRAGELTSQGVAELYGVGVGVAIRELRRAGVAVPGPGRPAGKPTALHVKVISRYRRGQSVNQIAAEVGLSHRRINTILRRNHVARRPGRQNLFRHDMSQEDRQSLAGRVKELREAAGLTQAGLASRTGLSAETISVLEHAQTTPTRKTMNAVAKALKVKPEDLLGSPRAAAPPNS